MTETSFGRLDALKKTASNVIKFAGSIMTGEVVMVPVHRVNYADKVDSLVGKQDVRDHMYVGWLSDYQIVNTALKSAELSVVDAPDLQMDEVNYALFETTTSDAQ